jgi:hypothetical protein
MSTKKVSNLMVGSLIVGAMDVEGGSGGEARRKVDIEADILESIARVAL